MDKYHVIKKMRKLLGKLALYLQGNVMPETQLRNIVGELERLVTELNENKKYTSGSLVTRVSVFLDAFKHHTGIMPSRNPDILSIPDLNNFLSKELGINVNRDYIFKGHRNEMPLHLLFI